MRLIGAIFSLILLGLSAPLYSANGDNEALQGLVDELRQLSTKARQQRAADRWLLNDLEDLVARYDWPWRNQLLLEDFSDGDFTNNPSWQLISGQFWVDGRLGLRTRSQKQARQPQREAPPPREEKQDIGRALLGALLQEALRDEDQNSRQQPPEPEATRDSYETAEIQLETPIPLVFAAKIEFSVHTAPGENGQLEFAVVQDQQSSSGYRATLYLGQRPSLELVSILNGRTRVINTANIAAINDGQPHTLEWRREASGQIEILLDENSLFKTPDRSFRYPFKRLAITNQGGDFAIASIGLFGG